jgi:hypothetical protein
LEPSSSLRRRNSLSLPLSLSNYTFQRKDLQRWTRRIQTFQR